MSFLFFLVFNLFNISYSAIPLFDCGATNVRAMVVDEKGVIAGKASQPNATLPGEENPEFHVWDADRIFNQLECAVQALQGLPAEQVKVVTITTFGVDGALTDAESNLLYPVISWKCPRTAEVMKHIGKYISQEELNRISGVGAFAFNTIYKLVWLKEIARTCWKRPMRGSSSPTFWPASSPESWPRTARWPELPSLRIWKRATFPAYPEPPRPAPRPFPAHG